MGRRRGPQPLRWDTNVTPLALTLEHWSLPGLAVDVRTTSPSLDPRGLTQAPGPDGTTRVSLTFA